ncbi:Protein TolQ1 [Candidatus Zixiibacteriota bacterium]|nr:Protein TolQ1 [candidate division Zixibacteria bacterium]
MGNTLILALGFFSGGIWQIIGELSLFGVVILTILLLFSLVSWGIMLNKWRMFKRVDEQSLIFLNSFRRSRKFSDAVTQANSLKLTPLSGIFNSGFNEIRDLLSVGPEGGMSNQSVRPLTEKEMEIINLTLERVSTEQISILEKYVVFLATTANASPFLGLMGTVVGIMDAFWSIGSRGSASLAVVAPGIAEALLVTVVGLGAAIPAVIGFNWANNKLKHYNDAATNFSLEFLARVKKDLT